MIYCEECGIKIHYKERFETRDGKRVCIICLEEKYKGAVEDEID
jgi:formylmethanofuran dehydrogenase subunit E